MDINRINDIKAFLLKVEGVLTDSQSILLDNGRSTFVLNEKDTFALRMAKMNGYPVGIYSEFLGQDDILFFNRYGIDNSDIFTFNKPNSSVLTDFAQNNNIATNNVLFAPSDIPDLVEIEFAGYVASPIDAAEEIKEKSDYVSPFRGGHLFVRDVIERVLKAHEKWVFDTVTYSKLF